MLTSGASDSSNEHPGFGFATSPSPPLPAPFVLGKARRHGEYVPERSFYYRNALFLPANFSRITTDASIVFILSNLEGLLRRRGESLRISTAGPLRRV